MNTFRLTFLSLAAVFAAAVLSAQTPEEVSAKYNEAAGLINDKQFEQAIPVLNEAVTLGFEVGGDAIETVQKAQRLLPLCHYQVALNMAKENNFEGALGELETSIELGELHGDTNTVRKAAAMISRIYTVMGAEAFNSKDYAKAIDIFSKGYEANPSDTDLALNLATSYAENGQLDEAMNVYKEIIALESRHSKYQKPAEEAREKAAYYLTVQAAGAAGSGNTDLVYQYIDQILEINPANADAHMLRLQTANNAKSYQNVIQWGDAAAEAQITPEAKSNAYFLLGAAYQNLENNAKAIEAYSKVTDGPYVSTAKSEITELRK